MEKAISQWEELKRKMPAVRSTQESTTKSPLLTKHVARAHLSVVVEIEYLGRRLNFQSERSAWAAHYCLAKRGVGGVNPEPHEQSKAESAQAQVRYPD